MLVCFCCTYADSYISIQVLVKIRTIDCGVPQFTSQSIASTSSQHSHTRIMILPDPPPKYTLEESSTSVPVCSICNKPMQNGIQGFDGCSHRYHAECLIQKAGRCPACRPNDPNWTQVALYAGGAVAGAALAPVVAPIALGAVGFGASGVVGGSLAALIQGGIGNVAAGSLFAICQSVGAGGALPVLGYVAGAGLGVAATAAAAEQAGGTENDERDTNDNAERKNNEQ
ncbi:hypothetical protein AcV5_003701 [Taiwanofungus camphoratus]|nr:hypothetical protein AcV5_003701 [Antrodia cinnamomea]KAI0922234.1 hypothetical protein AcW2_006986 [Antrodia cinnamomea]